MLSISGAVKKAVSMDNGPQDMSEKGICAEGMTLPVKTEDRFEVSQERILSKRLARTSLQCTYCVPVWNRGNPAGENFALMQDI